MLSYSNTTVSAPVGNATYSNGPATLRGDQTYIFGWIATARPMFDGNNFTGSVTEQAMRTATSCYMRGLKEAINIRTNSANAWQWRRICFTLKGNYMFQPGLANTAPYQFYTQIPSAGMVRTMNNLNTDDKGNRLLDHMFRGIQGQDWINVFNAPLDTTRVTVKFDRTRSIASGNDSGIVRTYKQWYPMNKNIVYNDDEAGDNMSINFRSTDGKAGMGDYYVIDFFQCSDGADETDTMSVLPEATLYWHER